MTDQTDDKTTKTGGFTGDQSWTDVVQAFETAATWLGPADHPQLKAMYSIAKILDGDAVPQAAMISQFTLIHRGLLARGAKPSGGGGPAMSEEATILDMLDGWMDK